MSFYRVIVKVEGRHQFPIDMLRHDSLAPYDGHAVDLIVNLGHGHPDDRLLHNGVFIRYTPNRNWKPTTGRWESFGWVVLGFKLFDEAGNLVNSKGEEFIGI